MDLNPFDYAFLLLHSPTHHHVNALQGLKYGTSALLQKSPTSAITIYHQTLQFLKTVSLSAAKLVKLCLPWICVHKCPLTNLPALSQSCLPCLAEQGLTCWLGAPQWPPQAAALPLGMGEGRVLPAFPWDQGGASTTRSAQLFIPNLNKSGTSSPLPNLIEIGGRRGKMT